MSGDTKDQLSSCPGIFCLVNTIEIESTDFIKEQLYFCQSSLFLSLKFRHQLNLLEDLLIVLRNLGHLKIRQKTFIHIFQIRFEGNANGSVGTAMPDQFWKSDGNFVVGISNFESKKTFSTKDYRFMFERLREKAGFLDETICRISDILVKLVAKISITINLIHQKILT